MCIHNWQLLYDLEMAMETYDCLVLDLEGASDVFALAQRALGSSTKVGQLAVADFFKLDIKSDSEIGLVVRSVPTLSHQGCVS